MANWVLKGLRTGVKSAGYPTRPEETPGVSPGRPTGTRLKSVGAADTLVACCPTGAITRTNGAIAIDQGRCVHCFRCRRGIEEPAAWQPGYEWGAQGGEATAALNKLAAIFGRSLHVRFVDAGACGACMSEARQINNPYYNMHRVLVIGSISALIGILYATIQGEIKRLLAHSTIENMGIVAASIGAAMVFVASDHRVVGAIALIAALYHLANHSVYKALLFLGAGAVEAGTGTRDLDRLGGIIRGMPWTSAFFLIGVLSIAALPPFNGFVSEWLTLQTMLRSAVLSSTVIKIVFALCGALLALTAGLAVTCFVKVFATGFLGMSRSPAAAQAHEAHIGTRTSLGLLAALCVVLGVLPTYVIPAIDRAVTPLAHESATAALVPPFFIANAQQPQNLPSAFLAEFHDLGAQVGREFLPGRSLVVLHRGEERNPVVFAMSTSYMLVALAAILGLIFVVFRLLTRSRGLARRAAWDGGLRHLLPGLTYTATAFSNPVRVIFAALLTPAASEESTEAVAVHFRTAITREYTEVHVIDRFILHPPIVILRNLAAFARRMHVGHVNAYAAYVLLAMLFVLLVGMSIF